MFISRLFGKDEEEKASGESTGRSVFLIHRRCLLKRLVTLALFTSRIKLHVIEMRSLNLIANKLI